MARRIDLDAERAVRAAKSEVDEDPVIVVLGGEEFKLPSEPPLAFLEATLFSSVKPELIFQACRALLGEDYDRFIAHRPMMADANKLVSDAWKFWGLSKGESKASGRSSTGTSRRSKRTSKGSTRSTSDKPSGESKPSE